MYVPPDVALACIKLVYVAVVSEAAGKDHATCSIRVWREMKSVLREDDAIAQSLEELLRLRLTFQCFPSRRISNVW